MPAKELSETGVAGACLQATNLRPCFGTEILPEQIQGNAPEDVEVLSGAIHMDPALIFAKRYIQRSVHAILYTPAGTDSVGNRHCIGRLAAVVIAPLRWNRIADLAGRFDHHDRAQPGPQIGREAPARKDVAGYAVACLDTAVIFLDFPDARWCGPPLQTRFNVSRNRPS